MRWMTLFVALLLAGALQAAQVTGVTTSAFGSNDAGTSIDITVAFDGTVSAATGTTKLLLSVGRLANDEAYAYANSNQSGTSITLTYVVRAGDNSADLDYKDANALTGVPGMVGNLPIPGTAGSLGFIATVQIDTAPLVRSVSTTLAVGTYGIGHVIPVIVQFSEPVFLTNPKTGTITLQLAASTKTAAYVSGDGTSQLQFAYTITSGDSVTQLDYASTTALAITGGTTISDAVSSGKTATLTLPTGGSSSLRTINVDATPPTVTAITSTASNGSYKSGDSIPISVQFSEVVTVAGIPKLTLNTTPTPAATATYSSGSGTANLLFTYIVGSSDVSGDLDVATLTISPGTIVDSVGNPASTVIPTGAVPGSLQTNKTLVIALLPSILSVTGSLPSATYTTGNNVSITVTLSGSTTVSGSGAKLTLETGAIDQQVDLSSSTSSTLVFIYTVQAGDVNPILNYTSTSALSLGNVVINGFSGLTLPLPVLTSTNSLKASSIKVDTTASGDPTLAISSQPIPANGSNPTITVTITANENVTGFDNVLTDLTLSTNATAVITNTSAKNYTATLTPKGDLYTSDIQPNALQVSLKTRTGSTTLAADSYVSINGNIGVIDIAVTINSSTPTLVTLKSALPLNIPISTPVYLPGGISMTVGIPAGAAQDLVGNNNTLTADKSFVYDPMAPIGSIRIPSSSTSPYVFTVQFSELVTAPLAASFTATGDTVGTPVSAGTNAWTVPVTPATAGGNVSLILNANAVRDAALNFNLGTGATAYAPTYITKIESVQTTPITKGPGQTVTLVATLSRSVTLVLTSSLPTLALQTGTAPAQAQLTTSAGPTNTLTFIYTVGSSDSSSDLDVVGADALALKGGTIDGLTTMKVPVSGAAGSLSITSAVTIDSTRPGDIIFGVPTITGALKALMTISFGEPITATGSGALDASDFTVSNGVVVGTVMQASNGRSATVEFTLPTTSVLTSYVVSLKTGAVADLAGNTSTDTPTATIVYDPVAPVLTLSATPGDKATAPLSVNISGSKYVTGMATDDCNVTNGVASSISAAVGTSFTVGLTPTATLKLAQAAAVGVNTIRLQAVGGDVTVAAGTVLRLVDTGVATVVRLSTTSATTVTSAGVNVGIDAVLPAALASGSVAWPANGLLVTMSVRANACVDLIGQNNGATATPIAVRYDPTNPMFRIASPTTLAANGTEVFTLTPSEPVSGLTAAKLITDGVVKSVVESTDRLTWTVAVTPVGTTSVSLAIAANAAIDGAGNPSLAEAAAIFSIKPQITKVGADNVDGTYNLGTRLRMRVTFSEAVLVSGVPELRLNLTASGRAALYTSGTGSKELLFEYTIVDGDATPDLDYMSTTALSLPNGALIADIDSGNNATLTLAAPGQPGSIAAFSAIVVNDGDPSGPGKPGIGDQPAGSGGCGAGSGIALILAGGWLGLGLSLRRRRRAARASSYSIRYNGV